ncbi:MAG: diguanylate cyclase [Lachnospiraceae bacterium]|nr:diguanylate cyclase [Lachnospiraceae bacterium]
MKQKKVKSVYACLMVYFIAFVAFSVYILFFTDVKHFLQITKENDYTEGWQLENGEEVDISEISAGDYNGVLKVSKILPKEMLETDSLYFSTSNLKFKVYVNGDEVYSYDTEENMTGVGDGISYHMIGLGTKDEEGLVVIDGAAVFPKGRGGRINEMQFGFEEHFRYYIIRKNLAGLALSLLMMLFGVVVIGFYFGLSRKNPMMQSLWALGLTAFLFGLWSLCDTGVPQLLTGMTYASRTNVYGLLHLAGFPLIYFVNKITKSKKNIFLYLSFITMFWGFGTLLLSRYTLGKDMHEMVGTIYLAYAAQLILMIGMLVENEIYCHKQNISSNLKYFFIGAGIFVVASVADMFRYLVDHIGSVGHGTWFRLGLIIFFIMMGVQIFDWWSLEKTSLERDRFVNHILQYAMDADDPEIRINKALEYLCLELHADRAYIFEDMNDGTFDNTYEFCAEGVTDEIDNLKGLPYDGVIDVWYEEYEKGGHILIYDIEKYRDVCLNMYNVLKPQDINTLVTGPLIQEGKYIGFFGVDNPPAEMMEEVSEIIRLLMFFLSEMVSQRDNRKRLLEYSFHDSMTGVGNRRAEKEFERNELDTSRSYGYVMCDINGLKAVNDNQGHEAGDEMIKVVAESLSEVFGRDNVYRMGRDEFAVYTYEDSLDKFESKIDKVKTVVNEKSVYVAIGYSYAQGGDPDYRTHKLAADNKMYDEKKEFYRNNRDRRKAQAD